MGEASLTNIQLALQLVQSHIYTLLCLCHETFNGLLTSSDSLGCAVGKIAASKPTEAENKSR
jgi:hypothetical protein